MRMDRVLQTKYQGIHVVVHCKSGNTYKGIVSGPEETPVRLIDENGRLLYVDGDQIEAIGYFYPEK